MISLNQGLAWRDFDDEIVVYHEASGNSFLLSGMAAAIFAALRVAPLERRALASRFCPLDSDSEAREVFEASLQFLAELEAVRIGSASPAALG
jgi:PqqD family protein of HPr-rel-A system